MKLGKTSLVILVMGILLVAFGSLGVARAGQVKEINQIDNDLVVAERRLSNIQLNDLRSKKDALDEQVGQVMLQLDEAKEELRQPVESIDVTEAVYQAADTCGVEIVRITTTELGNDTLESITCKVIHLNISVEGEVLNIIDFVTTLNTGYPTGIVRSVQMDATGLTEEIIAEAEEEEEGEGEEGEGEEGEGEEEESNPMASIRMDVYAYRG